MAGAGFGRKLLREPQAPVLRPPDAVRCPDIAIRGDLPRLRDNAGDAHIMFGFLSLRKRRAGSPSPQLVGC